MGVMAKIQGIKGTSARNINRVSSSGLDTTRFNERQLRPWKRYEMRINGADIDTIKNQLRHLDYKSTQRYIHAINEAQKVNYLKYCPKIDKRDPKKSDLL